MPYKFTLLLLLAVNMIFSQDLYVANNSYLYARDVVVYVNNDIRLETATSNLYFRGDAQLLQDADSKNSDAGELSIFQNQTTNVYEYNYFCSPVGVSVDGTAQANVDFNGSNIHDPANDADVSNVTSSAYLFTSAYEGTATELSREWLYTMRDGEGYWSWQQIYDTGAAGTGYGFTMKGSPNTNNVIDFRGRPNNGTFTVSCNFDGVDNQISSGNLNTVVTLTGNPYPSALDLKLFIIGNTSTLEGGTAAGLTIISGEIFFWEQKVKNSHLLRNYEGGYGVYTPGDLSNLADNGTYTSAAFEDYNDVDGSTNGTTTGNTTDFSANNARRFAAVGQGFVIQSNLITGGGNVTFDNSMRLYLVEDSNPLGNGSIFAKNENKKTGDSAKKLNVMSHNGVDYKSIIENPTIIPEIRLHTHIDDTFYKENVIAFRESTPDNNAYNRFFDGANINKLSSDAYLISEDKELVIKSLNYDENARLRLGLKASKDNTDFSVEIHNIEKIPLNVNVYVFDNENNTYTDINNGTFDITLDKGTHNNRFEITFKKKIFGVDDNTFTDFKVFQNNKISELKILNPNNLNLKSFNLIDISGKQVIIDVIDSNSKKRTYSTKSLSDGFYIVKIQTANNQVFSKKVVISNKK